MKNYLKEYANRLISNGYTVIPVEGKRPHGKNWQHSRYTSYEDICQNLDDWSIDKSKNVGILCNRTQLIGVDIDVYDPVVTNLMIDYLRNNYGGGLLFRYGLRPKVLIPFRYIGANTNKRQTPLYKLPNSQNGKESRIEIIRGGQFVAFGEYVTDTGSKVTYTWERFDDKGVVTSEKASLLDVPKEHLPIIDDGGIEEIFAYFEKLCGERGAGHKQTASTNAITTYDDSTDWVSKDKSKVTLPMPEIKRVLGEIARLDPDFVKDYPTWLSTGMALWHQTDGSHDGYDLWVKWSRMADNFNEHDHKTGIYEKRWESFNPEKGGSDVTTMRSVIYHYNELMRKEENAEYHQFVEAVNKASHEGELEEVVRKISRTKMSVINREALVAPIKRKYKEFGVELASISFVRKQIAYDLTETDVPEWLRNWVYINDKEMFFNTELKYTLSPYSFDANFNSNIITDSGDTHSKASRVALDVYDIPKVKGLRYRPTHDVLISENGYVYANTYRYDVVPEMPEELSEDQQWGVDIFKKHIMEHIIKDPVDAHNFMQWLAWNVQNTGKLIGWACVLHGVEGDGKTTIANIMQHVLGKPNVRIVGNEVVQGAFKSWVAGHVFCAIEEMTVTGKDRDIVMNNLKQYITNSEVDLHKKGENAETVPNFTHYLFLTNNIDGLPINGNDRRYFFISSRFQNRKQLRKFKEENPDYYDNLIYVRNNPNLYAGAIRKFLMEYPISEEFKNKKEAPLNDTKRRVIQSASGCDEAKILQEVLRQNLPNGMNRSLFNQTMFARLHVDSEHLLSLRKKWKSIFASMGMYPITGFVARSSSYHYFYSEDPSQWTIDGTHDGLIDKKRVKPFIKTEEDLIFEQDESEEDWSDL